jgi:hypothetical protein
MECSVLLKVSKHVRDLILILVFFAFICACNLEIKTLSSIGDDLTSSMALILLALE